MIPLQGYGAGSIPSRALDTITCKKGGRRSGTNMQLFELIAKIIVLLLSVILGSDASVLAR
jgi:hypothetical protein